MKCQFCNQTILSGELYIRDWQEQFYHASHHNIEVKCGCCNALIIPSTSAITVSEDYHLCNYCQQQAVIYEEQLKKCYEAVFQFYKMGGISLPKSKIQLDLVNFDLMPPLVRGRVSYDTSLAYYKVIILKGLTKSISCGVLAHELMHIVLLEGNYQFTDQETEGLCELASYFVYKMIDDDISREWIKRMNKNPDSTYGEGYRIMFKKVKKSGSLQAFLNEM